MAFEFGGGAAVVELRDVYLTYRSEALAEETDAASGTAGGPEAGEGQLKGINLELKAGECVLVTGPSGCGKTSLLRLINGLIPRYYPGDVQGEIRLNGQDMRDRPLYAFAPLVGTVFQNPRAQFFNVDTTGELAFTSENLGRPPEEIRASLRRTVRQLSLEKLIGRNIFHLSGGEKQQIACGTVDVAKPPLILLDEPSANLDFSAMLRLREIIKIWQREGKTILIAEHRLAYVWDLPDRVLIMNEGRITHTFTAGSHLRLKQADLRRLGLRSSRLKDPAEVTLPEASAAQGDRLLTFAAYRFSYPPSLFGRGERQTERWAAEELSWAENEITALIAPNGSGKSTLLRCLGGLERRAQGVLRYRGRNYKNKARRELCFLVMQEAGQQLFTESVIEEVLLSLPERKSAPAEALHRARQMLAKVNLQDLAERHPASLSGGQKQRLAVACALASEREILLFDEPTSGLDYKHMMETAALLKQLQKEGKSILLATHDTELIEAACTRKADLRRLSRRN